ncbi:MAG: vitamin K epoxide reductase family protein [Anaerolineales bacterium]|nr:vitamin K epoxide reductase family protein [Anaerolineales bacterium]
MSEPIEETSLNQPLAASSARVQGFELALAVIIGMIGALIYTSAAAAKRLKNGTDCLPLAWLELAIPILAIAGLGVAGYLAYVETQAVPAVCGPVGDCNAVQSSPYARLFGLLPIGVLGVIGYVAILVAWLWGRFRVDPLARYAPLAVFGLALVGTLFSLYLTYLEPFVIKAVCIWCLTSAIIITLLMLLSHKSAFQAMNIHKS